MEMVAAHDVGKAVNPLSCEGQIEGGVVMSIGFALREHYPIDENSNLIYLTYFCQYSMQVMDNVSWAFHCAHTTAQTYGFLDHSTAVSAAESVRRPVQPVR